MAKAEGTEGHYLSDCATAYASTDWTSPEISNLSDERVQQILRCERGHGRRVADHA
ncbi:MAG: hypothetical protein ACTHM6_11755 [Tepidisphaeraceae bacterium]